MSETVKTGGTEGPLLIWITNPEAAARIVGRGKAFADNRGLELNVVSVQPEMRGDWQGILRDLERLDAAARESGAELTVVYSGDKLKAAKKLVWQLLPSAMFAGSPGKGCSNTFAEALTDEFPDIPIYCVDSKGQVNRYGK